MDKLDIDVNEVKKLVELVEKHHLEELSFEHADMCITVKGKASHREAPVSVNAASYSHPSELIISADEHEPLQPVEIEPSEDMESNIIDIVAPLVGVFYRSSAPDAPACVEVGDMIEVGTEVGLIEAMKVFSPIPSEVAGEVVEIPGQNGKLVREGDPLVRVRVKEE